MIIIKRRDIIRVAALGGASLILRPATAFATTHRDPPVRPPEQILGQLLHFGFEYLFGVDIPAPAIDTFINWVLSETTKSGRTGSVVSRSQGTSLRGGGQALINVGLHKGGSGYLIHGHMIDGGKTAFSHDGSAPSHTHPSMQQNAAAIVAKAHAYHKARNQ